MLCLFTANIFKKLFVRYTLQQMKNSLICWLHIFLLHCYLLTKQFLVIQTLYILRSCVCIVFINIFLTPNIIKYNEIYPFFFQHFHLFLCLNLCSVCCLFGCWEFCHLGQHSRYISSALLFSRIIRAVRKQSFLSV